MKKPKISKLILLVSALTILLTNSCKKEELNLAPCSVILYQPLNAATELTLYDSISWHKVTDPEGDVISYDVYLGTDTDPELVSQNQSGTFFKPTQPLIVDTTYYWKVAAKDSKGAFSESDIWSFSTHNAPPSEFSLLSPPNFSGNVFLGLCTLEWQESIDLEGGMITYDVFLRHEDNSTFLHISNQDSTSFHITSGLQTFTTYYWKVVAKDPVEQTTESEIWSFTTSNM